MNFLHLPLWGLVLGVLVVLNTLVLGLVWRRLNRLKASAAHLNSITQRHERDIAQQRYALAMLRQLVVGTDPDGEPIKTDDEMLAAAVKDLDKTAAEIKPQDMVVIPDAEMTVEKMSDGHILQSIKKAVKENQIAISRQPIVTLPERDIRYYEIFSRINVGKEGYIPAHKFISVAKNNNLISSIDNILLLRCLQMIKASAHKKPTADYFINISAQTLSNKNYIRSLVDFLAANPKLSSRLIFEITQQDSLQISAMARNVMESLALLGCRFSMDQIKILGIDVNRLLDQNITFIKLDSRSLQKDLENPSNRKRIKKIKTSLDSQGIQTIIEKVENEKQFFNTLDLQIDLGQGYFFGQPEMLA